MPESWTTLGPASQASAMPWHVLSSVTDADDGIDYLIRISDANPTRIVSDTSSAFLISDSIISTP